MESIQELLHAPATLFQCSPDYSDYVGDMYRNVGISCGIFALVTIISTYVCTSTSLLKTIRTFASCQIERSFHVRYCRVFEFGI